MDAGLFKDLHLRTIPAGTNLIHTSGYFERGKGAARYVRATDQNAISSNGRDIISAAYNNGSGGRTLAEATAAVEKEEMRWRKKDGAGSWFEIAEQQPDPYMFGARGGAYVNESTGVAFPAAGAPDPDPYVPPDNDDTAALQALLDFTFFWGRYNRRNQHLSWGAGDFRTTKPLYVGRGFGYVNPHIRGVGTSPGQGYGGTHIWSDHDGPCLAVSGAFLGRFEEFSITGPLFAPIGGKQLGNASGTPLADDLEAANWDDDSARPGTLHSRRYSPCAGIAIDPYMGSKAADYYNESNASTLPKWAPTTGRDGHYGATNASSALDFTRLSIRGFTAGVAIQPSDYDANGDFMRFHSCSFHRNVYGISVGNSQSRGVHVVDCTITTVFVGLTSSTHGQRNGRFNGAITNLQMGECINVFDFSNHPAVLGSTTFINLYCESTYRIGYVGIGGGTGGHLRFINPVFGMHLVDSGGRGNPHSFIGNRGGQASHMQVTFEGGGADHYGPVFPVACRLEVRGDFQMFNATQSTPYDGGTELYKRFAHNATAGGFIPSYLSTEGREFDLSYFAHDLDGGANNTPVRLDGRYARVHGGPQWAPILEAPNGVSRERIPNPQVRGRLDKGLFTSNSYVESTGVWTFTVNLTKAEASLLGIHKGGVLLNEDDQAVFWISDRTGGPGSWQVTAQKMNGRRGTTDLIDLAGLTNGYVVSVGGRWMSPDTPHFFSAQQQSSSLTAVARDNGDWAAWTFAVGDHIHVDPYADSWATDPEITAVSAGALTIAGTTTRTVARKRIGVMRRAHP
jgi:hypothetical protein